jgi:hypothetical protein
MPVGPTTCSETFQTALDLWEHHNSIPHNDILSEEEMAWHLLDRMIQNEYSLEFKPSCKNTGITLSGPKVNCSSNLSHSRSNGF